MQGEGRVGVGGGGYRGRSTPRSTGLDELSQHLEAVRREVAQWASRPLAHMPTVHRQGHAHLADGQVHLPQAEQTKKAAGQNSTCTNVTTGSQNWKAPLTEAQTDKFHPFPHGQVSLLSDT